MAVLVRTRRLSNPARRNPSKAKMQRMGAGRSAQMKYKSRKETERYVASGRTNPAKKRLSLKQKLHFGTARQRAAARASLSKRRTNPSTRRKKLPYLRNKQKPPTGRTLRRLTSTTRRKRRKNIGEIVSISLAGLGNPGRKRRRNTGMARKRLKKTASAKAARRAYRRRKVSNPGVTRRRRRASSHRRVVRRRRANPGVTSYRRRRVGRRRNPMFRVRRVGRRRNPGIGGLATGAISKALGVIGGAVGSKYLTQLALGGNNTGLMGYGGNLVASIALGWGVGKVMKNKEFGVMVTAGGIAALVLRVLSDNTPIGQYVNLSLSGMGKGGDTGLGIIQDSTFPVPQVFAPGSMTNAIVPRGTRMAISSAMSSQTAQMKSAGSGMGAMIGGRKVRRAIM